MPKKIIVLNIVISLLELIGIFFLLWFLHGELWFPITVTSMVVLILFSVFYRSVLSNPFGEGLKIEDNQFEDYKEMIEKAEKLRGKPIQVKYVEYKNLINPAFFHKDTVYINLGGLKQDQNFFEGMLAHELGHAISNQSRKFISGSLKMSSILASGLSIYRNNLLRRKGRINKYYDNFLFIIFQILKYSDRFFLDPYYRAEEYIANQWCLDLSDGHSLRTYYYKLVVTAKPESLRYDERHPSPQEMLDDMERCMDINEYDEDVYHIKDKVYYIKNTTNKVEQAKKKMDFFLHKANQQNPDVLYTISYNYKNGVGTKKNLEEALSYGLKAYELGHNRSSYILGLIYEELDQLEEALNYLIIAKENNIKNAPIIINRVQRKMRENSIIEHQEV